MIVIGKANKRRLTMENRKAQEAIINGEPYLKAEKAQEVLQMTYSALRNQVIIGNIKKDYPVGKRQAYYRKKDVEDLAEAMGLIQLYKTVEPAGKSIVRPAKGKEDIQETTQIARQHFGDNAYGTEKRMEWFKKVPNGDYVLEHDGVIVGYFSMQGIKPEAIEHVFNRRNGASVQLEDMEPIEPGKPLDIHISGIGVKTGLSRKDAKKYGLDLISGMLNQLIKLGEQGIEIRRLWAKSSTVPGIKLSRDLGFTELGYINNEQIGFVLEMDPDKANHPLVKLYLERYKEAVKNSKEVSK